MKTILKSVLFAVIITAFLSVPSSHAHFGMVIPSASVVSADDTRDILLDLSFTHPFEQTGMPLVKPRHFSVIFGDQSTSLLSRLKETRTLNHKAWQASYRVKRPGTYHFFMEPKPYWEPAEDCFIIHYTKTVISAFGDDEGWDAELGLKTEIVPVSKPFALYTHNLFQGIVKLNGKAVPYATVEVEFYNPGKNAVAPNELMITQTIKADQNGLFSYTVPQSGWWGFAALNPANYSMVHQGEKKDVELGAVIWVQFHDWITQN